MKVWMKVWTDLLQDPQVIASGRDGVLVMIELIGTSKRNGRDAVLEPHEASPKALMARLGSWFRRPGQIAKALVTLAENGLIELWEGEPDGPNSSLLCGDGRALLDQHRAESGRVLVDFRSVWVRVARHSEFWMETKSGAERTARWRERKQVAQGLAPLFDHAKARGDVTSRPSHPATNGDASVTPRERERVEGAPQGPPLRSRSPGRKTVEDRVAALSDLGRKHWGALRAAGLYERPRDEHARLDLAEALATQQVASEDLRALLADMLPGEARVSVEASRCAEIALALRTPGRRAEALRRIRERTDEDGLTRDEALALDREAEMLALEHPREQSFYRRALRAPLWWRRVAGGLPIEEVPLLYRGMIWDEQAGQLAPEPDPRTRRAELEELIARNAAWRAEHREPLPWERVG